VAHWTLPDGAVITERDVLRRAAKAVEAGLHPVDAVLRVWRGSPTGTGRFAATQLIRGCTPWLSSLIADNREVAAAMRARADFLDHPDHPCPRCGHPNSRHDGRPCLPTDTFIPCLDCHYAHPADPPGDDPSCE
jgi:hypothetical protein